jgi:tetratricopeptide (TPR) repeat protein
MNYCNRAITLRKLRRYQEALGDLERAVELEPSNAVYNFNRGLVYFEMGSYDAAIAEFTATILADKLLYKVRGSALLLSLQSHFITPRCGQAYFNRANCYRRVGRLEEAVTDLRIAVGLDGSLATGHNSLGLALCELGRYEEAGKSMDAAVEKANTNATYLCNRGLVRYHLGRIEDAIRVGFVAVYLLLSTSFPTLECLLVAGLERRIEAWRRRCCDVLPSR